MTGKFGWTVFETSMLLYILIWYADPRSKSHQFDSRGAFSNTQQFSQVDPNEINLKGYKKHNFSTKKRRKFSLIISFYGGQ